MGAPTLIDFDRLEEDLDARAEAYRAAEPFPHAVLDGVLTASAFHEAASEFPAIGDEFWKGFLHVNQTKYSNTEPDTWGPTLHAVARELCGPRFVSYLERLTGIEGLKSDWSMDGGGLHQTLRGGYLNIHADFTTHHTHMHWARRVNILLYLNEAEWQEQWGGLLELWDSDMTEVKARVTPAGNRMLVFSTGEDTFHGHPEGLTCPPDVARRSLALYYFTEEAEVRRRATNYRPRPGESTTRRAAIAADRKVLDVYDRVKRRLGVSDDKVNALLTRIDRLRPRK